MDVVEWQKLDLTKASLVKREVDQLTTKLVDAANPASGVPPPSQALIASIQSRIYELEQFYLSNSDGERAILFEKERLRLRKAIQPFYQSTSNTTVTGTGTGNDGRSISSAARHNSVNYNMPQSASNPVNSTPQSVNTLVMKSSKVSSGNSVSKSQTTRKSSQPLYSWEERSEQQRGPKDEIVIDGISFVPTSAPGLYARNMTREESEALLQDKFVDFQVVLTQEEMTILAARKKAEKNDAKLGKSVAATSSVHNVIPYIETKRIIQDMLRPSQPDKWINPEGMKTFQK